METPSFGSKDTHKNPEQAQENIALSEQEKNIQEVFKLNPELQQIAMDAIHDDKLATLYRIENKNIISEPNGITSHADLKGQWFSPDLKTVVGYLKKSQKEKGAKLLMVKVPKDQVEAFHVSKNPIASQMDVEGDNYVIPELLERKYIDLDDTEKVTGKIETIHKATEELESKLKEFETKEAIQLYSKYLKTIFPDSKVQDIVWHNSSDPIIEFIKQNDGLEQFFFAKGKDSIWKLLADPENGNPNQYAVKINTVNPKIEDFDSNDHDGQTYRMKFAMSEGFDAVLIENKENPEDSERVVFNNSQIQILGSEKDIKKFKEFIELKNRS